MSPRPRISACVAIAILSVVGCSNGGGSGGSSDSPTAERVAVSVPISSSVPLSLSAGVPVTTAVHFELPADFDWGRLTGASADLGTTLSQLTIVRTDGGTSPAPTVEFSLRVAAGDAAGVGCSGGAEALGAVVTGDTTFAQTSVTPTEATMPQVAVDIINSGDFTVCGSVTSSVDVNLILGGLVASLGVEDDCDSPQELAGLWVGPYSCEDLCQGTPSTESGDVKIRITQSGRTAVYWDDGGAVYVGSVCGSSFRHWGFGGNYFEYGTFTRTGPSAATKSSTWVHTQVFQCGGTCSDALDLSPN